MEEKQTIKPYHLWTVGEDEYKLKLSVEAIVNLEDKINCNLLEILNDSMPSLKNMKAIIHAALLKYNHGIKLEDVNEILTKYFENGGSQIELLKDVIMPIFAVSGFFPKTMAQNMEKSLKNMKMETLGD